MPAPLLIPLGQPLFSSHECPAFLLQVNNAGVFVGGSVLEDTQEQFDNTYGVNVGGMYFTAQAVAKHMIEKNIKGRIINTASIVATVIPPGTALYSSSKAAVVSLTK